MGRRTLACTLLAAAAVAGGCGERAEPRGELEPHYPVTVDGVGEEPVVVEAPPRRIVALDPGPAGFVLALGRGERLVGIPDATARALPAPNAERVATDAGSVHVDAVVRLRPDLILATPATDPVDLARVARASGAPLYVQPADSVAEVERAALELGFAVGEPVEARRLAGSIRRGVADIEERVEDERPVAVFVDTGFLLTVPARSLVGDLVRRAGGESVAGENPHPEPYRPCEVARLDPDVILHVSQEANRETPRRPPRAIACPTRPEPIRSAVVPEDLVTVAGPRLPRALEAVARALHPDAFD